jgi:hypothetical protein
MHESGGEASADALKLLLGTLKSFGRALEQVWCDSVAHVVLFLNMCKLQCKELALEVEDYLGYPSRFQVSSSSSCRYLAVHHTDTCAVLL